MPSVSVKAIESFSSEDPNYPASNLLKPGNKKWKCRTAGEPQAFVVLRLEEPAHLTGIDIGNEHSALIQVLVARSGPSNPAFTEILYATKFMNAVDSRNSTSTNGVQCFSSSALLASAAAEKWDLVKIICTQPYNSRVRYGLTFVVLHTSTSAGGMEKKERKSLVPEKFQQQIRAEADRSKALQGLSFGRFKLREESPDSDEAAGFSNSFARWKSKGTTTTAGPSVSALMRDASNTPKALQKTVPMPGSVRSVAQAKPKPQAFEESDEEEEEKNSKGGCKNGVKINRNDESLLYDAEDDKPSKKLNESVTRGGDRNEGSRDVTVTPKAEPKRPGKLHDTSSSKFKDFLGFSGGSDRPPKRNDERKSVNSTPEARHSVGNGSHSEKKKTPSKPSDHQSARPPLSIEKQKIHPAKRLSSPTSPPSNARNTSPSLKKAKLTLDLEDESDPEVKKPVQYKPFGKLLENVVLVISGLQNPDRANVRNQALAMGAKYKPDWDASCTHLICAYKNTPKYNQVHGKGKIVKKDWIEKCYTNRRKLSWRKFSLDTAEANAPDSEDEIEDIANKPVERVAPVVEDGPVVGTVQEDAVMLHELSDTDEEAVGGPAPIEPVYEKSTEEEGDRAGEESATVGRDFFKGKKFYIHPELGAIDEIKLERYIKEFKGVISKEMSGVDYVIARSKHPLPPSSRAELVKPLWVYECNDMECLIPVNRYRIV